QVPGAVYAEVRSAPTDGPDQRSGPGGAVESAEAFYPRLSEDSDLAPLICALAVFSVPFSLDDASHLVATTAEQLAPNLDTLVRRGHLTCASARGGPVYAFRNELLRAAALSRIGSRSLVRLHERAGDAIASAWIDADACTLEAASRARAGAAHHEQAGLFSEARLSAMRAGRSFAVLERPADAEAMFAKALSLLQRDAKNTDPKAELEIRIQLVRALHRRDRRSDRQVVSLLVRCQTLIGRLQGGHSGYEIEVLASLSEVMRERGNFARGEDALLQMKAIDCPAEYPVDAIILGSEVLHAWNRGELGEVLEAWRRLSGTQIQLPHRHGTPVQEVQRLAYRRVCLASAHVALAQSVQMNKDGAQQASDTAIRLIGQMQEPLNECRVLILSAIAAMWAGQNTSAVSLAMAARSIAQRFDLPVREAMSSALLAACRSEQDVARSIPMLDASVAVLKEYKSNVNLVLINYLHARALCRARRWSEAQIAIKSAIKATQSTSFIAFLAELERQEVVIALEAGIRAKPQSATRLRRAMSRARDQNALLFVSRIAETAAHYDIDIAPKSTN
ncbi:MAG: hypothetical protein AAFY64_08240, partial [Pseudomonadota bacterium]